MDNNTLILKMNKKKKTKKSTLESDLLVLNQYSQFHQMSLEEIIDEADDDEENIKKMRKRRINDRLDDYVEYLMAAEIKDKGKETKHYSARTIHNKLARIISFYNYYEIHLPSVYLPPIPDNEKASDVPTMEEMSKVVHNTGNVKYRSIIQHMYSSGLSANEIINLTKEQFRIATSDYHDADTVEECVEQLLKKIDQGVAIIPTWELTRGKTNYSFITFNNPETTRDICYFLRDKADYSDPRLYEIKMDALKKGFQRVSKKNNMGKTSSGRNRFHSHAMRKIFATTLIGAEINGVPIDSLFVEFLLGHKLPKSMEPYYKNRPKRLKKIYMQIVDDLSVEKVNVVTVSDEEILAMKKKMQEQEDLLDEIFNKFDEIDKGITHK